MPFIPESRFFRGKVHSRQALRFGLSSHQALRDLRCSGPPASPISQADKTLLPEGRGAGSMGRGKSRSGRWAEPRWSSKPEKRKWHSEGIQWLSEDCPFKLWNACANSTLLLDINNSVLQLHLTHSLDHTSLRFRYKCFYYNIIGSGFRNKKNGIVSLKLDKFRKSLLKTCSLLWHTVSLSHFVTVKKYKTISQTHNIWADTRSKLSRGCNLTYIPKQRRNGAARLWLNNPIRALCD